MLEARRLKLHLLLASSTTLSSPLLNIKSSSQLAIADYTVECTSADSDLLLQPQHADGLLNGLFVDDGKKRSSEKQGEKACVGRGSIRSVLTLDADHHSISTSGGRWYQIVPE